MEQTSRNTDKSIYEHQNDAKLIRCLVAQRAEYSVAKKCKNTANMVSIVYIIVAIISSWISVDWLTVISTSLAVLVALSSKYLGRAVDERKKHAASIQQYIDATLYSHALGISTEIWGQIPLNSDIAESIANVDTAQLSDFENWYSDYSHLSPKEQVFHSQKENIRWDSELRKQYRKIIWICAASVLVVMLLGFILINPSFLRAICVLSWFAPVADFFASNLKELEDSIQRLKILKIKCDDVEASIRTSTDADVIKKLVVIQNEIRKNRETGFLIPDWFYKTHKQKQQTREDSIAENMTSLNSD